MAEPRGMDAKLWTRASGELGLSGLAILERFGGQGFGWTELGVALSEAGRCLAPIPLFGVAGLVAPVVVTLAGEANCAQWIGPIAAGEVASLAWMEKSGAADPLETSVVFDADSGEVSGDKAFVLDADAAKRFFVVARDAGSAGPEGLVLVAVEGDAEGIEIHRDESLDPTRRLFSLRFVRAPAQRVDQGAHFLHAFAAAIDTATTLYCAEMVGGMERVLETAVDYAGERYQFGRPIGSFQAIKHKAADMLIDFEGARTVTRAALDALDDPAVSVAERSLLASVAKAHASRAYVRMATESNQIQGGVAYTWEYDAHLYYRRAQSGSLYLGDAASHELRLAEMLAQDAGGATR